MVALECCYTVIRRGAGNYSVWPCDYRVPDGWEAFGDPGSRKECIRTIERQWIDAGLPIQSCGLEPVTGHQVEERTVPEIFEHIVARNGNAPAVVFDDSIVGFNELNSRSNRLARYLIECDVGPESLVAVAIPRSVELVVAILAILKAGGAYVPIDIDYPRERIDYMLRDSRPIAIVRTRSVSLANPGIRDVVVDDPELLVDCAGRDDADITDGERRSPLHLLHPMYVIYTSGSTGKPKGVVVTQRGTAVVVATQAATVAAGLGDRVLQWASISFDAAFWDMTLGLLSGASLIMAPAEDLLPGRPLENTLLKHAVTHATLPPVALSATDSTHALAGGTVISTGDACSASLAARWSVGRRMFNGYGPTETTIGATIGGPIVSGVEPNIGKPFIGYRVHVLDENMEQVPVGQAGEMYLAGPGVARGYLNNPRLTAERFLPDPYGPPGSRMYRSGDLGVVDNNGDLKFLGRNDNQVKVRGFRVELEEIEVVLDRHPAVDLAAVVKHGAPDDAVIAAYVTTAPGCDVTVSELRNYLSRSLPAYLSPAFFTIVDQLPITPNGKIDRATLGRWPVDTTPAPVKHRGELSTYERYVCDLVSKILDVPRVSPADNFFNIGGHSVLATRLASRIREDFGVQIPMRSVFSAGDLAALAAKIEYAVTDTKVHR